jgi:hypothetical protein
MPTIVTSILWKNEYMRFAGLRPRERLHSLSSGDLRRARLAMQPLIKPPPTGQRGYVGNRGFYSSETIQVYDTASGIFAGAAVGTATGVGIHQINQAAGFQEQAAQGIFQRTTIHPGTTAIGQVELKPPTSRFSAVNVDVLINGFPTELHFQRKDSP